MESPIAYLPTDRRLALAQGVDLPEHCTGAAIFADISGFTALTEALVRALGPQRGAEELPRQLNMVYDAVIAETDRFGGSVLGFSGDAITCWFDDQMPVTIASEAMVETGAGAGARRAVACAFAIQQAMQPFAAVSIPNAGTVNLTIKVAVTAGPARRFIVGDPQLQLVDVLAGAAVARLASAEHLAERGDVVVDEACLALLADAVQVRTWRVDAESGERYAVLDRLQREVAPRPWPERDSVTLSDAQLRSWLLAPVYTRLKSGLGEFLTELRPAVALFVRFSGIDYDHDDQAGTKLNGYIAWAMQVINRFGGFLLQLTIGDKGSYFYAAFGAPLAYEDNAARAMGAALELLRVPPELGLDITAQVGVSQGRMRTGAYGGETRRTYGVLGDNVNMAARLMQQAPAGQIYVGSDARQATADRFVWGNLPPLKLKGKADPVVAYRLLAVQDRPTIKLQEPQYTLPMIGREAELAQIRGELEHVRQGRGRIVGITAEAGMGKSRLVAEVIRAAREEQIVAYGGECQSYGTNTSYLVWRNIWRAFFGLAPAMNAEEQIRTLTLELTAINPALLPRLPLLGAVLNLPIPDNDLTSGFDARLRKESLATLLVDCLRARAQAMPLLLVLEDCHWLDPLSHDLLEVVGRAIVNLPVLIVLAYRPPQVQRLLALRVDQFSYFRRVGLTLLPDAEIAELIQAKLRQVYGADAVLPPELARQIAARAEGNPFYVEELLNYLRDREIDPQQPDVLEQIELPTSLASLILSRIDQLSENQQILLKVASVIGRLFRVAVLWGVSNQFGNQERVRDDLEILSSLELTPLDTPDPELAYLFKHILTQEVAYETLPFATRSMLHNQIGLHMERIYEGALEQHLDLLAYHFDLSENGEKRREYLLKAGAAAQAAYANTAAIDYYERSLSLLDDSERGSVLLRLAEVLKTIGEWVKAEQQAQAALALSEQLNDDSLQAQSQDAIGELRRKQGDYTMAHERYNRAQVLATRSGDRSTLARVLTNIGTLAVQQGDFAAAQERYRESLELRRSLGESANAANVLNNMSIVASFAGDTVAARNLQEESLAIYRTLGNRLMIALSLNNLGMFATDQGEYDLASASLEEALGLLRQIGDRSLLATALHTLANLHRTTGDYAEALAGYHESLSINRQLGDRWLLVQLLEDVGILMVQRGEHAEALRLIGAAATARGDLGAPLPPADQARLDAALAPARAALGEQAAIAQSEGGRIPFDQALERVERVVGGA
jgi:adenylate cyclase